MGCSYGNDNDSFSTPCLFSSPPSCFTKLGCGDESALFSKDDTSPHDLHGVGSGIFFLRMFLLPVTMTQLMYLLLTCLWRAPLKILAYAGLDDCYLFFTIDIIVLNIIVSSKGGSLQMSYNGSLCAVLGRCVCNE